MSTLTRSLLKPFKVVRRNRTNTGALMGSSQASGATSRSRANTDLASVNRIQTQEEEKTQGRSENKGIDKTAWISVCGAIVENLIYGIAIGAGYHRSVGTGVAIGVALLAESVPHKMTDFMLLVDVGMTRKVKHIEMSLNRELTLQ